jgi:hypothetical protein
MANTDDEERESTLGIGDIEIVERMKRRKDK